MKLFSKFIGFLFISMIYAQEPIGVTQPIVKEPASGCISGNCVDGWGKWQSDNGYYDGFWVNGKKQGYGLYVWNEYGNYIGFWNNDKMEGYGSYKDQNGRMTDGIYINGKLNGLGWESTKSGDYNRGIYKDHILETPYTYIDSGLDIGCTAGDCENKYGDYDWSNGDYFVGFFKNGIPLLGTYYFANGDYYTGNFNSNSQFHGQGRFFYKQGGYYGGEFANGNFNGRGYYSNKDYVTQIGIWENGKLIKSFKTD